MMAANYRHIGGLENRLGRHYSRFSASGPAAPLTAQSLDLRKSRNGGSNWRSWASIARHLAFVIPAGDRERVWPLFARARSTSGRCAVHNVGRHGVDPADHDGAAAVQIARGCLEGVLQS